MEKPVDTFEFSVFRETDLIINGRTKFFLRDTIRVPEASTVTITVTDDDGVLSGDNDTDEVADDDSGQEATIIDSDGNELGSGGKIYGEVYYWVSDDAGNRYMLVEIEQEGTAADFFAFVTDFGIPDPGTELTVDRKVNIKDNTLLPEYQTLAASLADPDPDPDPDTDPDPDPEPNPDPEPDYTFTAFNEFDLTLEGRENLFAGFNIMLPSTPTVFISVDDYDPYLSGDNLVNEYADDETGQVAAVRNAAGEKIGNGGQIFGEAYYWVSDSAGNRYMMIEIEQEGSADYYFAFHTDYGLPPSGVELFVEVKYNIKDSNFLLEYANMSVGEAPALAELDAGDAIL